MSSIERPSPHIDIATREAAAWFARLRADDVSEQDRTRFERWLAADPRNRLAFSGFERFWSTTGTYAAEREVAEVTRGAIAESKRVEKSRLIGGMRRRRYLALAASLLLAVGVVALLGVWPRFSNTYETAVGEQRSIVLDDGSRVTLNTNSEVRIAYSDKKRVVHLERGQAYFRVAKGKRPFEVEAKSGVVHAIGTAFDVYQIAGEVIVTVVEGTVVVADPTTVVKPSAHPGKELPAGRMLHASQRLELPDGKKVETVAVETAPVERSVSWLSGKLVFDNEPLASAVAEINRYSHKHVVIGDDTLQQLRMSGVFRVGDPDEFVDSVSRYFSLQVETDDRGRYVLYAKPGTEPQSTVGGRTSA